MTAETAQKVPVDAAEHTTAIIIGAGISGLDALIQFQRLLKLTDVVVYEKGSALGGTWAVNHYPGASCDIPIALYSFSFAPATEFNTQWPGAAGICRYYNRIVDQYGVRDRIVLHTLIQEARFSRSTGLWTVKLKNVETGEERTKTCNILVSAVGALSVPADPPFDATQFDGVVMHSAKWNSSVSLKDKDVVLLGNGCSAAQIIPAIIKDVKSLTQIARSKHSIVPPEAIPDNALTNGIVRWVPGLITVYRLAIFLVCESYFALFDTVSGAAGRRKILKVSSDYIRRTAPAKFHDKLEYDFEFGQKRRIIDFPGMTAALHDPKFDLLLPDSIASAKGRTVVTETGKEVPAHIIITATGFKVADYLFPLKVFNSEGESLVDRWKGNGVKTYLSSMVSDFPNFWVLMGPNSVTGHSSALYNTECTVEMMIELLKPVVLSIQKGATSPAPTVEVTQKAEDDWFKAMRAEMDRKVFEKAGKMSWYVDPQTGTCTTLFPWGQLEFLRQTRDIKKERFVWTAV